MQKLGPFDRGVPAQALNAVIMAAMAASICSGEGPFGSVSISSVARSTAIESPSPATCSPPISSLVSMGGPWHRARAGRARRDASLRGRGQIRPAQAFLRLLR